ncbi:MAG: carbohydrate ABC transporter permease [Clostridia bacterium]
MSKRQTLRVMLIVLVVCVNVFPIYWMLITSLRPDTEILSRPPKLLLNFGKLYFTNYENVLTGYSSGVRISIGALRFLLNSIAVASLSTALSLVIAYPASYVVTRIKFPGKEFAAGLLFVCYLIPPLALMVPIFQISVNLGLHNSLPGMIAVETVFNLPIALWVIRGYLTGVPFEIEEAGFIDGCSRLGVMGRITLPMIVPGLSVIAIICFTNTWNSYLFPMLFLRSEEIKTASVGLSIYLNEQIGMVWGEMMAAGAIIAFPVLLVYFFFQKNLIGGVTDGAVKG